MDWEELRKTIILITVCILIIGAAFISIILVGSYVFFNKFSNDLFQNINMQESKTNYKIRKKKIHKPIRRKSKTTYRLKHDF